MYVIDVDDDDRTLRRMLAIVLRVFRDQFPDGLVELGTVADNDRPSS